tara:strand:+ start:17612 stop:18637 length:1026 start_codon:yes stop_codon:yes gene_type:complete
MPKKILLANSWQTPGEHFHNAIESDWYKTIFNIKNRLFYSTTEFYQGLNMACSLMPITCGSVSSPMGLGSDSLPVNIDLFGEKTFLADSMQFHLEYMLRVHDQGVWYIMPTFRGEEHDKRHLNQFFHSEAEIAGDLDAVMHLVESYLVRMTESIINDSVIDLGNKLSGLDHIQHLLSFKDSNFPRVTFEEACSILGDNSDFYEEVLPGVKSITSKGELKLMEHFGGLVWLTHLHAQTVPFYQANDEANPTYAKCADLLMGIGETVGCGERHTSKEETMASLERHQVDPAEYEWYLDMKEHYPLKTSGFGLGIERYILWLLKHDDIRDIHLLPRLKGETYKV